MRFLKATWRTEFDTYWEKHQSDAFHKLCQEENIAAEKPNSLIWQFIFTNRLPRDQKIVDVLTYKPKILERKAILERVAAKIKEYIDTFIEGMGDSS